MFNPEGALSSAKLEGKNVTQELRFVRSNDYAYLLKLFGFRETWPEDYQKLACNLTDRLISIRLAVENIEPHGDDAVLVTLRDNIGYTFPIVKAFAVLLKGAQKFNNVLGHHEKHKVTVTELNSVL